MSVIDIGSVWANGDQLTPTALNAKWTAATFNSSAVDDSSTALSSGAIIVKDLGVSTAKIAADAVETAKIANNAVTAGKMATTQDWSTFTITLPDDVVTTDIILDDNVTFVKLAAADQATQANMEAEAASKRVAPDVMKYHPAAVKAYGMVDTSADTIAGGYNVTSSSTSGSKTTVTLSETMANTNYSVQVAMISATNTRTAVVSTTGKTTTAFVVDSPGISSNEDFYFTVFGQIA